MPGSSKYVTLSSRVMQPKAPETAVPKKPADVRLLGPAVFAAILIAVALVTPYLPRIVP